VKIKGNFVDVQALKCEDLKRRILLTLATLTVCMFTYGQYDIGIKLGGGYSRMYDSYTPLNFTHTMQFQPSGQFGFYCLYHINSTFSFGTELFFVRINGKETNTRIVYDSLNKANAQGTDIFHTHISYVAVPAYFGIVIKKFTINVGAQVLLRFHTNGLETFKITEGRIDTSWSNKIDSLPIKGINIVPRLGVVYQLTNRFSVEATYYCGINNILKSCITDRTWRTQQITMGVRFKLYHKEPSIEMRYD
jgi:hypothetical protein